MFAVFATVLCLASLSHSAPLACEDLMRPLAQLDPDHLQGRWAFVAGGLTDSAAADVLKARLSVTVDLHNSSFTQANRHADQCQYHSHNFSVEGQTVTLKVRGYNFTGTFVHTSCPDCMALKLDLVAPKHKLVDFYLFSRSRAVTQEHMEEFRAQVECLKLPPPVVMDGTQDLCPEQTASEPAAKTEEKTEGQEA